MKALNKEEYICKKNKLKEKRLTWLNSDEYQKVKAKHLKRINKRALRYFTRRINNIRSFDEPRILEDFNFDLYYFKYLEYNANDFSPFLNDLEKKFYYLNIDATVSQSQDLSWISVKVWLKEDV